jgi:hypothetical protein
MSVRIMSEVFERSKTQGNARLVLLSLADSCNDDASCWPSIRKIAEKANISEPITKKYLNALIQIGVITRDEREDFSGRQTSNLYTIIVDRIGDDEIPKSVLQQVVSPSRVKSVEGVTKVNVGGGNPVQRVVGVTKVSLPIMNHHKEPKIEPSSDSATATSNSSESTDLFPTEIKANAKASFATTQRNDPPTEANAKVTAARKKSPPKIVDEKFIAELQRLNPDKDVEAEAQKAKTWIAANPPRQFSQKFLANWVIRSTATTKPERFSNF